MKFSEEILKQLDLEHSKVKEPVNVMRIDDMLDFMENCAMRIQSKSRVYSKTLVADIRLDCMDIVTAQLNDFAQVFMDLIIFMRKKEGTYRGGVSLRYCINSFDTFGFEQTENEKTFLKELLLRNEITHDYFNRELHQQKLIWIMENCSDGAVDVYQDIKKYCMEQNLTLLYFDKNAE